MTDPKHVMEQALRDILATDRTTVNDTDAWTRIRGIANAALTAALQERQGEAESVAKDVARWKRLEVIGAAPFGSVNLDAGTVLRFQSLVDFVDRDIAAHPSRGELTAPPAAVVPEGWRKALDAFAATQRGLPQAHIAAALVDELERAMLAVAPTPQAAPAPDWRELCRRLCVELFACDQQMTSSMYEDGEPMWRTGKIVADVLRDAKEALAAAPTPQAAQAVAPPDRKFALGDRVTKTSGSSWTGTVVGSYSTTLTPIGYAVESETETGSVQIYPEKALRAHGITQGENGGAA